MDVLEIILALAAFLVIVGVGCELDLTVLKNVVSNRRSLFAALIGIGSQFFVMPCVCWLLSYLCGVRGVAVLGFVVMTGAMPGGSMSNIFTLWAKGSIELSAFMTTVSTLLSFGMIPFWLVVVANAAGIDSSLVNFVAIAQTFGMLLVGLFLGIAWSRCFPSASKTAAKGINVVFIALLVVSYALVVYQYREVFRTLPAKVYVAAAFLWPISAGGSYFLAWMSGFAPATCRTILMEVSFPNLALGFAIATRIIKDEETLGLLAPFPTLTYAMVTLYGSVSVIFFRAMHKRHLRNGVKDTDDFMKTLEADPTKEPKSDADQIATLPMETKSDSFTEEVSPAANTSPEMQV